MGGDRSPLSHAEREAAFRQATGSLFDLCGKEFERATLRSLKGGALYL